MRHRRRIIGGAIAVAVLASVWLLRWTLFEGAVRAQIHKEVAQLIGGEVTIGRLSGSLLFGVTARDVTVRAPGWDATIASVHVGYGPLGLSKPDIRIAGARVTVAAGKPSEPAGPGSALTERLKEAEKFEFPGRLRVKDSVVVLGAGREVAVEELDIKGREGSLRARPSLPEPSSLTADVRPRAAGTAIDISWDRYLQVHGVLGGESDLRVDATLGELRDLLPVRVKGDASLHLRVTGRTPDVTGSLEAQELSIAGAPPITMILPVETKQGAIVIQRGAHATPYGEVTIEARLPLTATEPMEASVSVREAPVCGGLPEAARPWVPPVLTARVVARGSIDSPEIALHVETGKAAFRLPVPIGEIGSVLLDATMKGGFARVELDATLGGGPVHAEGTWDLGRMIVNAHVTATDALVLEEDNAWLRVDPDVRLSGKVPGGLILSGDVRIPLAIIYEEFAAPKTPSGKLSAPGLRLPLAAGGGAIIPGLEAFDGLKLDLKVETTGEVRLENSIVGTILRGSLHLKGTAAEPAVSGTVDVGQGEIRLASGVFIRILKGHLEMYADPGRDPSVHFEGQSGEGEGAIHVAVSGPLPQPALTLQSEPPRPQEELVAMLAFGRAPGSIGEREALGALVQQIYNRVTDEWPSAEPKRSLLSGLKLSAQAAEKPPASLPWDLPARSTASGTAIRTEYILNRYLSIVAESNFENNFSGDLRLRIRFP